MIVAKYKFNPNTYANYLPEFNSEFTDYTKSDVNNSDGTITRTIESNSLPTLMSFGEGIDEATNRGKCLLEILDMNTSNITSMGNMFRYCTNLTSIICNWNTSISTNMGSMFYGSTGLTSLDLSNFNTSNVTDMGWMFDGCWSLTSLDLSGWDTSKVTDMYWMFKGCSKLKTIRMVGCSGATRTKIEEALTAVGIKDNVTIVTE